MPRKKSRSSRVLVKRSPYPGSPRKKSTRKRSTKKKKSNAQTSRRRMPTRSHSRNGGPRRFRASSNQSSIRELRRLGFTHDGKGKMYAQPMGERRKRQITVNDEDVSNQLTHLFGTDVEEILKGLPDILKGLPDGLEEPLRPFLSNTKIEGDEISTPDLQCNEDMKQILESIAKAEFKDEYLPDLITILVSHSAVADPSDCAGYTSNVADASESKQPKSPLAHSEEFDDLMTDMLK